MNADLYPGLAPIHLFGQNLPPGDAGQDGGRQVDAVFFQIECTAGVSKSCAADTEHVADVFQSQGQVV